MKYQRFFLLAAASICAFFPVTAKAGEPRLISTFSNWNVYTMMDDGHKACFMAIKGFVGDPNDSRKRGDAYAIITRRPAEGVKNEFSYLAGYNYKPGSDVSVEIGAEKFQLFTQGGTAWATDSDTDNKLAKAIRAGDSMTVRSTSSKGVKTVDKVDLKDSEKAYKKLDDECN
jgi:hypothetical protein